MRLKLEDLLADNTFRRFVLNPNQGDHHVWEEFANSTEENNAIIEEARQLIIDFYDPLTPEEFEFQAIDFRRRINVTRSEKEDIISLYDQRRPRQSIWLKYAAVISFIVVSAAIVFFTIGNFDSSGQVVDRTKNIITKSTSKGQKMTIVFPEGTVVKLNSESSISYPEEFPDDIREVLLEGEAYFEVAHYDEWPFKVQSQNVTTEVLGTSFNVSSYKENNVVSVALVEGNVRVSSSHSEPIDLVPSKMAVFNNEKKSTLVTDFNLVEVTGWKDNIVYFKKADFEKVQLTLERWFDVKFIYEKAPVFEGGYTGDFEDENLENILKGISSNEFLYEIKGKKVFIN